MSEHRTTMRAALAFANTSRVLADLDPAARPLAPVKKSGLPKKLRTDAAAIAAMQERLWAEATTGSRRRVLLVLQGIDTAGKGGTTEHVVGACGPIGVQYTAFKAPTLQEREHDFLWRIRPKTPPPGVVGIFDRSHYEDVLVPVVHRQIDAVELARRYAAINAFERELADAGTTIVKCFLHISPQTQRQRLLARLDTPEKRWKFSAQDLAERARWEDYQRAFASMLLECDSAVAPWYVVPSDSKKYRNWAVGELLRETLAELDPRYPDVELDVDTLRARLSEG